MTNGWKVTGGFRKKVNVTNIPTNFEDAGTRPPFDVNPFRASIVDNQINYRNSLEFYLVKARAEVYNSRNLNSLGD